MFYIILMFMTSLSAAETIICDQIIESFAHQDTQEQTMVSCSTCFNPETQQRATLLGHENIQLDYIWHGGGYSYSGQMLQADQINRTPCFTLSNSGRMTHTDVLYASLEFWHEINPHTIL